MSEISGVGNEGGVSPVRFHQGPLSGRTVDSPAVRRGSDDVQVSRLSTYLQQLRSTPTMREDLVAEVRRELEAGVYEESHRLDVALDEMIGEVQGDDL